MLIRADVTCFYCGHVSGQVEGDPQNAGTRWSFRSSAGATSRVRPRGRGIRCRRCGGPVFLDEVETVRLSFPGAERELVAVAR